MLVYLLVEIMIIWYLLFIFSLKFSNITLRKDPSVFTVFVIQYDYLISLFNKNVTRSKELS